MIETCVIIGGGIGGLVTGCFLAKEGCKVTILEKHDIIGGGLHCFWKHGVFFETGMHYISGFQEDGVLSKIFKYFDIDDKLKIKELDKDAFDIVHVGSDNQIYPMGIGKENYISLMVEKFPDQAKNIQKYMDDIYKMADAVPLYNLRVENENIGYFNEDFLISFGAYIESYTDDEKLQAVLAWNNSLYAGERYSTPIFIHALITKFYIEGASRFVGGSQQLADAMVEYIEARGGEVIPSSEVVGINVNDSKKVTNVLTSNGKSYEGEYYISGIHPTGVLNMIDPSKIQRSYRERLNGLENTYSVFTVYVSFKPKTFKYINSTYYYFDDYQTVWETLKFDDDSFPPGFMLITPPSENQGEYAEKAIINCMMNFDRVREWEHTKLGNREEGYKAFKASYQQKIIDKVNGVFPDFEDSIKNVFSSTPLTLRDYFGTKEGSLYGYKKDCNNFLRSQVLPRTKIENLLLTGQNINLHGIMGVPLSSILTVGSLYGMDYIVNKINECNFVEK